MQNKNLPGRTLVTLTRKISTISGLEVEFWQILFHGVRCMLKRSLVSITVKIGTFSENKMTFPVSYP